MRVSVRMSYDGTGYSGWQVQPNSKTIQGDIQDCLATLYQSEIPIIGCGRTDAGVHADDYYFHCDLLNDEYNLDELKYKLNKMLSSQIAIRAIDQVHDDFHARFHALKRSYRYCLHFKKDPFVDRFSYQYSLGTNLDVDLLNHISYIISSYSDFTTFCKTNSDSSTMLCEIYKSHWYFTDASQSTLVFEITANRFLRGMIRLLVGAHININRGKITIQELKNALDTQSQLKLSWSVPAKGLSLSSIEY